MRYVLLFVLMLLAAVLLSVPEVAVGLYNTALHTEGRTLLIPLYASTPMAAFGLAMFAVLNYLLCHRSLKQAFVGGAALHHQRDPLAEFLLVLRIFHAVPAMMRAHRREALFEKRDVLGPVHEAHMRHRVDEAARI